MRHFYSIVFLFLLPLVGVRGQQKEPITITADSLVNRKDGEEIMHLKGNVRFVQGQLSGSANEAFQYKARNIIEMKGNVVINQDMMMLQSPHVKYDGNSRIARAENGFYLVDRDASITARRGTYDLNIQRADAFGEVKANQGGSFVTSNALTYYRSTQTSIASDNVVITSGTDTLRADETNFVRATNETIAKGNVELVNDSTILFCDYLYDAKHLGITNASGEVSIYDKTNNTIIHGDSLSRIRDSNYTVVPLHPLVLLLDSTVTSDSITGRKRVVIDTLFVTAEKIEAYGGDSVRLIATDSVRMIRLNFSARGTLLSYNKSQSLMTLAGSGRQRLWHDSTEIISDSVVMFTRGKKIDKILAIGKTFATTPFEDANFPERVNQLSSRKMLLTIIEDTVRNLLAMENALSIYFVLENNSPSGVNHATGDTIRIDFNDKKPSRVAVLHETEGEYIPERFIGRRGSAFRLSNYERSTILRPSKEDFLLQWKPKDFVPRSDSLQLK